ncbi:Dna Damage-Binding Protein 2 [Manis pentadactyla]|nr:Dna Damage-Binding Protein 2 [Manis pentadactyla]
MAPGLQKSFLHSLASYLIFQKAAPFDRRATSLAWHPAHPSTLAVGSKGGDIMLWNFCIKDKPIFIKGIGAGGRSITGLKSNPLNTNLSGTYNIWFCSLDVSARSQVLVTGDNVGHVILLNMDGREFWNLRMHKKKVMHMALNPCCDWLLATAPVDRTVKIWDLCQATWHRCNLIIVGRYPDLNFKSCTSHELRTIDVFDGSSGKMMYQLYDPESSGIISVRLGPSNDDGKKQGFNLLY